MRVTTLALTAEVPDLDGGVGWAEFESWLVAMREEVPAAALALALDEAQERLIDGVCGPKWAPLRGVVAPFCCPRCQVDRDFARKGRRTRPRVIRTAAGVVEVRLWNVGCRACGRVFAPLMLMLGMHGKRRTDRLTLDLAELGLEMSFRRAASVSSRHGVPASVGDAHRAVADAAAVIAGGVGEGGWLGAADPGRSAPVVLLDGTGVRAGARKLGTSCNVVLALDARTGPARRRRAETRFLAAGVGSTWGALAEQLATVPAPRVVVVDGEQAITDLVTRLWPQAAIQRCWWHLPRGLRQALYRDGQVNPLVRTRAAELGDLLRATYRHNLDIEAALDAYDTFTTDLPSSCLAARIFLTEARPHVFTCLDPAVNRDLAAVGGPELGSGVIERVMRELNARTDIGGARWSTGGLTDLVNLFLARTTNHPAWVETWRQQHQPNVISFRLAKFNGA